MMMNLEHLRLHGDIGRSEASCRTPSSEDPGRIQGLLFVNMHCTESLKPATTAIRHLYTPVHATEE